jgi:hypothetical protein
VALWLEGLLALAAAGAGLYFVRWRGWSVEQAGTLVEATVPLDWLSLPFKIVYQLAERLIGFITLILEGEGGLLWVLLWTVLLLLLVTRP